MMKKRKSACPISAAICLTFIFLTMLTACNSGEQAQDNKAIPIQEDAIIGDWVYTEDTLIYHFDGEGNYAVADSADIYYGGYDFDGETILLDDGSGVIQSGHFDFSEGGHLYLEGMDGSFFYVGESSLSEALNELPDLEEPPYFEEMGIVTDFMPGEGRYTLDNGGVYHYKDGSNYTTVPVDYSIEIIEDLDMGDGYREVSISVKAYFLTADMPPLQGDFLYSHTFEFADYYTGYLLPLTSIFGDSRIGENAHTFYIPFKGQEIEINIQNAVFYQNYVGDSYAIANSDFVVRMPVDYDGLVYCAEPNPGTLEAKNAKSEERESTTQLQELGDYSYFDPYEGLFCRIY